MFIYLSKKIAIPNNTKLNCLGWNRAEGYIACGGDEGLLKVLKLDAGKDGNLRGLAAPSNLSMNQSLEGHKGQIQVVIWNENYQKLTTSDQNGLIIVWMLYKGSWYEEMINNRNKSMVRGMSWNSDGQKICIVYEDGAVIVGSVDGSRIWSKELKNVKLTDVVWSPDSKLILFSLESGEIHVYDNQGSFTMRLSIECLPNPGQPMPVVGLDWYNGRNGWMEERCPVLAICYKNGCVQLMRAETDDAPVIVDTGMTASCCQWNHDGSLLAIAGTAQLLGETHDSNVVQFFNPFGQHIRTLKVPGQEVTACAWDGASLRLALAVDSFIYFANIRPDYRWTYFESTVVYAYTTPERLGTQVAFWDTRNPDECYVRNVRSLYAIASWGEHCVLASRASEQDFSPASSSASSSPIESAGDRGQYNLLICNAISTVVDSKSIDLEPLWVVINSTHVVAASRDNFLLWHYRSPRNRTTIAAGKQQRKVRMYHVDDRPSGVAEVIHDLDRSYEPATSLQATADPICCLEISDRMLLIGRESGTLQRYSLPQLALINRYPLDATPSKIAINCNSTRLAVISSTGILSFLDLEGSNNATRGGLNPAERKDVWSMRWASDNADLLAVMEKTRMYILRGNDPEEPLFTSGYICSFKELEVRVALLDELMQHPDKPNASEHLDDLEVKSLRDTRNLLEKVGLNEATTFVQENPHPRLWRLIAEAAVKELDLDAAEMAFVRCSDYPGVQLVRRLRGLHSEALRKAQVAAWFANYQQAENLYLEADRRDLAIALREKLGDCFQVLQLMRTGGSGVATDAQIAKAYNAIGQQLADKHDWEGAREYFEKSSNESMLIQCYYQLEDFEALEKSAKSLPENHPLLSTIAEMFFSVAMCAQAVDAYLKCGEMKSAVDACVALNQWDQAIELAKHYKLPEINDLLIQYGEHLLEKNRPLEAVALYKKAGRLLEAAKLLYQLAYKEREKGISSPLRLKKMHVLAALLVEQHGRSKLLGVDFLADMAPWLKDNAWRGAEAFHYLLLAHRQLYAGDLDAAMKSSLHLTRYDDLLNAEDVYALQALTACANKSFSFCNKAFIKLEALAEMEPSKKAEYEALALDIFTKYSTKDSRMSRSECKNCETMIADWSSVCPSCEIHFPICVATGRPLMDPSTIWTCPQCRHSAAEQEMRIRRSCPLCHVTLHQ